MDHSKKFIPSFNFELRIIQAQNVEPLKSKKNLFARLYLPVGNNKKIQLNGKKSVSSKSVPFWNESFSLECSCSQEFLKLLKQENMVLELRQSKIWGSSNLVGRGEIPWKTILESPNMEFKEWMKIDLTGRSDSENASTFKLPEVQVEIKIQVSSSGAEKKKMRLNYEWNECGCKYEHDQHAWFSAEDYEIFALGAALEAF